MTTNPDVRDSIDRLGNDAAAREALGSDAGHTRREARAKAGVLPSIDPVSGEVSGTGSGTGGSNSGEDYDDDHTAGSNTAR